MSTLRKWIEVVAYSLVVLGGSVIYIVRRRTPAIAYRSMIRLFCLTGGRSNDWMSRFIGVVAPRYHLPSANGALGNLSDRAALVRAVSSLRDRGYYLFEQRLPEEICDRLLEYAMSHPSDTYPMDGQGPGQSECLIYDRQKPRAVRYEFKTQDLLANPDIQRLLADLSLVAVAQEYLGSRPIIDVLAMWWLTAFSNRPDSTAAQYFHFDMDRPKWLKFFIYLTDVEPTSGPHTFVAGSHRSGMLPEHLLKKGYARLTDEEVAGIFASEDILEFSGPRGSILAEDTRGLHKGRMVEEGDRLMLQIQFSNSLFGGAYPKVAFQGAAIPELEERFRQFPEIYSAYR